MARLYKARKRISDGCFEWSVNDGLGGYFPCGSCASGECKHPTAESALTHMHEYVISELKASQPIPLTDIGNKPVPCEGGCGRIAKAFLLSADCSFLICEECINQLDKLVVFTEILEE